MSLNELQNKFLNFGYVRSPNNDKEWYAGGPGLLEPTKDITIHVLDDRIRLFKTKLFGESHSKRCYMDEITIAVFANISEFFDWCVNNGQKSNHGLPAFINSDI